MHGALCAVSQDKLDALRAALPASASFDMGEGEQLIGALQAALESVRGEGAIQIRAQDAHAVWLASTYETLAVHASNGVWIEKFDGPSKRRAASLHLRQGDVAAFIAETVLITDSDGMRLHKPWPSEPLMTRSPDSGRVS